VHSTVVPSSQAKQRFAAAGAEKGFAHQKRHATDNVQQTTCNRQRAADTGQQNMQHATVRRRRALPLRANVRDDE
jgi:hypothetical protein